MRLEREGRIGAHHPALPGHFPGRPIVPGVVLLAELERIIEEACKAQVVEWPHVKFTSPLKPEQSFVMRLEDSDGELFRFSVVSGDSLIATGSLRIAETL
ncbi:MAG: hypothetical protein ACREV0_07100 [Burkholderiales bacterium]